MNNKASAPEVNVEANPAGPAPVVIDLGKERRKQIKSLRNGKGGRLMEKINTAIELLKQQGTISAGAQPVIVVVRERRRKVGWLGA